MRAAKVDISLEQGTTERVRWVFDATALADPTEVDFRTCTAARMQVRQRYGSEVLLSASLTDGITGLGNGFITAEFSEAQTDGLRLPGGPLKRAVYDLEVVRADGSTERVLQGRVAVSPNVTRPL